jgi:hypothetical protein
MFVASYNFVIKRVLITPSAPVPVATSFRSQSTSQN